MIEWLRRVEASRVFLLTGDRTWTYGETLREVENRLSDQPRLCAPALTPSSVFELLAGIGGGGVTVVGPRQRVSRPVHAPLVVFSSGSTGVPKGVRLTLRNLAAAAAGSAKHLGHGPDDNWLLAMPLNHVGGLSILVRQVYTGGSITMLPVFEPESFASAMRGLVTMVSLVPTMLLRIFEFGPFDGLRAVLVGGGPIPDGLLEQADELGLPVLPTYGMTETFGQVATLKPDALLARKAHPLPGVELRIEPDGRIAVRGEQVSPGYVGQPDRTNPWFVTNDLGTIDQDGALRVLGRADALVVTGGENVNPGEVESVLRQHPGVVDVVVLGVPDEEWGQRLVCVYQGDAEGLSGWASQRLPGFMVPKRWEKVDAIPRTSIGKPDVATLRSRFGGGD